MDLRARMYAPLHGVAEDPATGIAAGALAGLLAGIDQRSDVTLQWRIAQGVEMGRPSLLEVTAVKENGKISAIRVAGASVLVSEGWIEVPND
jgi:trans-2,3-dihydro-3-hydroxyanthranilate isomerase